ncbi:MAG: hypothetical protein LRY73_12850 [Bacillus sp. (in: Bacteria)]|nr:hypothetical protein [Bacillus sp. (in: firmicutes)]
MTKKEKLLNYWHRFWHSYHLTKYYYYGYTWHEKRMDKHERALKKRPPRDGARSSRRSKSSFHSIKAWVQTKRNAMQQKPAEE